MITIIVIIIIIIIIIIIKEIFILGAHLPWPFSVRPCKFLNLRGPAEYHFRDVGSLYKDCYYYYYYYYIIKKSNPSALWKTLNEITSRKQRWISVSI